MSCGDVETFFRMWDLRFRPMVDAREQQDEVTPVNVADEAVGVTGSTVSGGQEPAKHWYVAYVGTRAEKAVRDRLNKEGIEAYAATQDEIRIRRNGRRVKIENPVITQYVFVHVTEKVRKVIVEYPYIHFFLTDKASKINDYGRHDLAVIPDRQMAVLQAMLQQADSRVKFATEGFALGDEVSILGWGEDIKGQIVRIRGEKAHFIGIRINQLGCAYMEVSPNRIIKLSGKKEKS